MKLLADIVNVATGGLAKEVISVIKEYWPPELAPEKKLEFESKMYQLETDRTRAGDEATNKASELINQRIAEYEGTASDLKTVPFLGPLMLFIRGSQRPVWGYATLWMDWQWFNGSFISLTDKQQATLYIVNILVLGFLFGERAVQNVAPMIADIFRAKARHS